MNQNGTNKTTIDCPVCRQQMSVTMPKPGVLNDLRVSMAVATHEKPMRCVCGAYFIFIMERAQVSWGLMPITNEQAATLDESKIFVPSLVVH